ncbi:unnamed protein product [Linum trigynum]|uniref:Uncharacterized protein n=1 Tax=Linum trigynum TaxID=586398 RepID=A0AAV2FCF9_9ROSI
MSLGGGQAFIVSQPRERGHFDHEPGSIETSYGSLLGGIVEQKNHDYFSSSASIHSMYEGWFLEEGDWWTWSMEGKKNGGAEVYSTSCKSYLAGMNGGRELMMNLVGNTWLLLIVTVWRGCRRCLRNMGGIHVIHCYCMGDLLNVDESRDMRANREHLAHGEGSVCVGGSVRQSAIGSLANVRSIIQCSVSSKISGEISSMFIQVEYIEDVECVPDGGVVPHRSDTKEPPA